MEHKLKLVKTGRKKYRKKRLQFPDFESSTIRYHLPNLTPAEQAEAARFRALTRKKARLQAKVGRLVTRLGRSDKQPPHAA